MSDYIADSEGQDLALLSGTYTTDEVNKVITFGSNGQANTALTFPTASSWMLIEVYDVEGVAGDVGYSKWSSNVYNLSTRMASARTTALAEYTTFKITCTHYKGDGTCDVYRGDESTALALASIDTGIVYTPSTTWLITDTREAPNPELCVDGGSDNGATYWYSYDSAYISFSSNNISVNNTSGTTKDAYMSRNGDPVIGKTYTCKINCTSYTSGSFRMVIGTTVGSWQSGTGVKTSDIVYTTGATPSLKLQFVDGSVLVADDYSVVEKK